jgi:hypothetical protein
MRKLSTLVPALRETSIAALIQRFLIAAQIPGSPLLLALTAAYPAIDDGLGSITGRVLALGSSVV